MSTITFDTLKFVQTLAHSGVDPKQAEAFAEAHRDSLTQLVEDQKESVKVSYEHLSTKSDVEKVRTDLAEMRSELRFVKWMIGIGMGVNGIVISALIALLFTFFSKV